MTTPTRRTVAVAAFIVAGLLGAGAVRTNAGSGSGPGPERPLPPGAGRGPEGVRQDITRAGEHVPYMIWRNGRFHEVHVRIKRELVHQPDGQVVEVVTELPGEVERTAREELPPRDPRLDVGNPSPDQQAEAQARISGGPVVVGPPPPPASPAEAVARAGGPRS